MENSTRKFPYALLWVMIFGPLVLANVAAFEALKNNDSLVMPFCIIAVVSWLIAWLIILADIKKNNLPNKTFWISSMVFVPLIAEIVYLIRRKKLLSANTAVS